MDDTRSRVDELRDEILNGRLNRRTVLKRAVALGLSAPVIAGLLAACGGDDDDDEATATSEGGAGATETMAPEEPTATTAPGEPTNTPAPEEPTATEGGAEPTATEAAAGERGGGGRLNILNWQAASILNPHLAQGGKDFDASRIYAEPLASFLDDGTLIPFLAREIPSLENGDVAEDGTSVTWRLREGVVWHDGEPFTAEDVQFTWQFATAPDAPTTTRGNFEPIENIEIVDDYTVTIQFGEPTPGWISIFTSPEGLIVPKHALQDWMGPDANDAPFNLAPIGTGPFMVTEFRPQDTVLYEINMDYWDPGKPFFDTAEYKGGGDATSAARAVLETGDVDYAENLQIESALLESLEAAGVGTVIVTFAQSVERILLNRTDPNVEIDGERSSLLAPHPALSELEFRQALTYLCDRDTISNELYGKTGQPTANILAGPPRFASTNTSYEFNPDKAAEMLDAAGWELVDGVRTKGDYSCNFVYQTSTNTVRQKTQEVVKQAMEEVGIKVELKAVDAGVFFSSDPGNPDTYTHFYTDLEMFTNSGTIYPLDYLRFYTSINPEVDIPSKVNEWSGRNINRWVGTEASDQFNELWLEATSELDPEKQNELFIGMNDLMVNDVVEIALVFRGDVSGISNEIKGHVPSAWGNWYYDIKDWYRE